MEAHEMIDMDALKRTLDPYILPSLLTDRRVLGDVRRELAERGQVHLLPELTRTGRMSPVIHLRDVR